VITGSSEWMIPVSCSAAFVSPACVQHTLKDHRSEHFSPQKQQGRFLPDMWMVFGRRYQTLMDGRFWVWSRIDSFVSGQKVQIHISCTLLKASECIQLSLMAGTLPPAKLLLTTHPLQKKKKIDDEIYTDEKDKQPGFKMFLSNTCGNYESHLSSRCLKCTTDSLSWRKLFWAWRFGLFRPKTTREQSSVDFPWAYELDVAQLRENVAMMWCCCQWNPEHGFPVWCCSYVSLW